MKNYQAKLDYLYRHQKCICPVCKEYMSYNQGIDIHHKCRKHKWRMKKFPLFIHSLLNLELLHSACHLSKDGSHIGDLQAEKMELFLKKRKKITDFVNLI